MGKVIKENFYVVHGWMLTDMDMKGNEIAVYAIIYGFSQDGESTFKGGLQYLADWTKTTKRGVMKNIQSLVEKGYIEKIENVINGVKFCEYRATEFHRVVNRVQRGSEQSSMGSELSSMGGSELSSPNNIYKNNKDNNIKGNINKKGASACESKNAINNETKKKNVLIYYPLDEKLNSAFSDYVYNRKKLRKPMTDRAITLAIKKLDEMTHDNDEKIEILNQSIMNGWAGLFPLKDEKKASGNAYIDAINGRMQVVDDWLKEYGNND